MLIYVNIVNYCVRQRTQNHSAASALSLDNQPFIRILKIRLVPAHAGVWTRLQTDNKHAQVFYAYQIIVHPDALVMF